MSEIDLSKAIAAESSNNTEAATTPETSESEIPFEANEGTEGYALFGNASELIDTISVKIFGNRPRYEAFDYNRYDSDLSDYPEIVEEAKDPSKQEKLSLVADLTQCTFGDIQSHKNEGYGLGWDTDKSPPKVYDNDKVDHVPYLDVYSELPAFDHETLTQGEIDLLENPDAEGAEALDMDNHGFDRSIEGPQLPVIEGERFPIIIQGNDEVTKALKLVNTIDFEEVTFCEKNGELQGTPTLGPSESDTDKVAEDDKEGEEDGVNLAANPEAVTEVNVNDVKVGDITNERTIQTMLRAEKESKDRKTIVDRLETRLGVLKESDEEEASDEEIDEAVEEVEEDADDGSPSEAQLNLMNTLIETGEAEGFEEAKQMVTGE